MFFDSFVLPTSFGIHVLHTGKAQYSLKPQAGGQKTDGSGSFSNAFHYILSLAAFVITAALEFQYGSCQCTLLFFCYWTSLQGWHKIMRVTRAGKSCKQNQKKLI